MTISLRNTASSHWNMLKHLDDNTKIDIIMMLTQSLKHHQEDTSFSASKFYGCWGDDGMSDEEFVDELKSMRTFRKDIVEL